MKTITSLLLLLSMSTLAINAKAQDIQLSQAYSNPILLNPAYSGGSESPAVFMNYRHQWPGFSPYITSIVSADIPIDKFSGGLGLSFINDKVDPFKTDNWGLSYAYSLKLPENISVRAGLQGNYIRKSIDRNKLPFGTVTDPRSGFTYTAQPIQIKDKAGFFDFSTGLLASGKVFNIGFAVHHLTEPNENLMYNGISPLPKRYSAHGSFTLFMDKFNFSPHLLYVRQGPFQQLVSGIYLNRNLFSTGLMCRHIPGNPDAVIITLALRHKYFRVGYSYDSAVSKPVMKIFGTHEIFLVGFIPYKKERKRLIPANLPVF